MYIPAANVLSRAVCANSEMGRTWMNDGWDELTPLFAKVSTESTSHVKWKYTPSDSHELKWVDHWRFNKEKILRKTHRRENYFCCVRDDVKLSQNIWLSTKFSTHVVWNYVGSFKVNFILLSLPSHLMDDLPQVNRRCEEDTFINQVYPVVVRIWPSSPSAKWPYPLEKSNHNLSNKTWQDTSG